MVNSNRKGKAGERELSKLFRSYGFEVYKEFYDLAQKEMLNNYEISLF